MESLLLQVNINGDIKMKKERIRINLDVSPELAKKLKAESDAKDITLNATIRLILQQYFEEKRDYDR